MLMPGRLLASSGTKQQYCQGAGCLLVRWVGHCRVGQYWRCGPRCASTSSAGRGV